MPQRGTNGTRPVGNRMPERASGLHDARPPFSGSPTRILHLISGDLWAGAEVMAYHLLEGLGAYPGTELSAVVLNHGTLSEGIKGLGIPTYVVDEKRHGFPRIVVEVRHIVKRIRPHVIHAHRYKENIAAFLAATGSGCARLVTTQHGLPEYHGQRPTLRHRIKHGLNHLLISKSFHKVIAVSEDIREFLIRKHGFRNDRVEVIHNGVRIPGQFDRKEPKGLFVIGSAGRLTPVKDYPLMIRVAREVANSADQVCFELAGDGPERERIKALIKESRLEDRFRLCGFLEDMDAFYRGLDLYLVTSFHEGIPMTVLEAMASGLPVVAPAVGGLKEIIAPGVEGYLVDTRDPVEFAQRCLDLYKDLSLRLRMGSAARHKVVGEFSVARMAESYYRMYQRVLGRP